MAHGCNSTYSEGGTQKIMVQGELVQKLAKPVPQSISQMW
jgi:hypothetical protein